MVQVKNSVYFGLFLYVFDQATDAGVIYDFYALWRAQEDNKGDGNDSITSFRSFFVANAGVVIMQRIISTVAIYRLTRSWKDAVLQIFDLMMVKAIRVNYTLGIDEKANPQRFLEILVLFCSLSL